MVGSVGEMNYFGMRGTKMERRNFQLPGIYLCAAVLMLFASITVAVPVTMTYGCFDVTFYSNGDTNGYATSQGDWTAEQMTDVAVGIQAWQSRIANSPGRQVQMHVFWSELDTYGTSVLGGSASYRVANGATMWNLGEYVWKEGFDPGTSSYGFDTIIQYDITAAGVSWNFGSDAPGSGEIDFRSVVTHEIGHSLGWDSSYDYDYDDWGWFSSSYEGLTAWDKNLVDSAGNRPFSGGTGTPNNFNEKDNPVFFDGSEASALYGGSVPVYAPDPFRSGSSLVHLDEAALGDLLMSPSVGIAQEIRGISELEWAMMTDMGWTIIPEPATFVFLIIGGLGLIKRR